MPVSNVTLDANSRVPETTMPDGLEHASDSIEYSLHTAKYDKLRDSFWQLYGKRRGTNMDWDILEDMRQDTAMDKTTIFFKPLANKDIVELMEINKDAYYYMYEGYLCSALDTLTKHLIVELELTALDDTITDLVVDGIVEMSGKSIISLMHTLHTNEVANIYEEVS